MNTIKTGNYYNPLFKLTNYFSTEEDYMKAVRSIPGFEDKEYERETMALKAWASHKKLDELKGQNVVKKAV